MYIHPNALWRGANHGPAATWQESLHHCPRHQALCLSDSHHALDVLPDGKGREDLHAQGASAARLTGARARRSCPKTDMLRAVACYAFQKETPDGKPTESAHPARFSPDDKFSKQRLICKKRFGLLPTQKAQVPL